MSVRKDIETASDAEWAIASQRADVMDSLFSQSNAASVGEAARELGLSIAMMYRLLARYRKNPTPSSLLPAKAGIIIGTTLLDSEVEGLVQRLIRSFYLIKERPRIADLHRHIAIECRRQDLKLPSYKAVWKRTWTSHTATHLGRTRTGRQRHPDYLGRNRRGSSRQPFHRPSLRLATLRQVIPQKLRQSIPHATLRAIENEFEGPWL